MNRPIRQSSTDPAYQPPPVPANEAERLKGLGSLDIDYSTADPLLDEITERMSRLYDTAISVVSMIDRECQIFRSASGIDAPGTDRAVAFCAHTIMGAEPLVVPDAIAHPLFSSNPLVLGDPHIRFYAGVPLRVPCRVNGTDMRLAMGALCIIDTNARPDIEDLAPLIEAADEVVDRLRSGAPWPVSDDHGRPDSAGALLSWLDGGQTLRVSVPRSCFGPGCLQQVHDILSMIDQRTVRRVDLDLQGCTVMSEEGLMALTVLTRTCRSVHIEVSIRPSPDVVPQLRRWGLVGPSTEPTG